MQQGTDSLLMTVNRGQNGQPIFEARKTYTLFRINSMAMTVKQVIVVTDFDAEGHPVYKEPRGRKSYLLKLKSRAYQSAPEKMFDGLVFEGQVPFWADTDRESPFYTGVMRGNALFNVVGDYQLIKETIQQKQRNPWADISLILHISKDEQETPVFSEFYKDTHAVMNRIIKNKTLAQ